MAPETIVDAVAQKTVWKIAKAQRGTPSGRTVPYSFMMKGSIQPNSAVPVPNMMPKPKSQKMGVPIQKSMRFFIRILEVFLARVNPASHIAKPACIKKTSAAPSNTQIVFTDENILLTVLSKIDLDKIITTPQRGGLLFGYKPVPPTTSQGAGFRFAQA